jgi:hypothetical protein
MGSVSICPPVCALIFNGGVIATLLLVSYVSINLGIVAVVAYKFLTAFLLRMDAIKVLICTLVKCLIATAVSQ